jgi:bifunctional non-homologous end joining protein LigD
MSVRTSHSGYIEACLPSPADKPPSGPDWVHEIKHGGYRLMARRDPFGIRLLTRNGHDWAPRYPLVEHAQGPLMPYRRRAVACDERGLAVFELLHGKRECRHVFLYAFDLLEPNGKNFR